MIRPALIDSDAVRATGTRPVGESKRDDSVAVKGCISLSIGQIARDFDGVVLVWSEKKPSSQNDKPSVRVTLGVADTSASIDPSKGIRDIVQELSVGVPSGIQRAWRLV